MAASRRMVRCLPALFAILTSFQTSCASAGEEESERLYVEGLIPFREGEEALQKALETGDERHREEGRAQFEKALSLFRQAASEEPPYDLAVYYLAVTYGKLGQHGEAVPHLTRTLQRRPNLLSARQDLAVAYFHLGRYQDALALLRELVTTQPNDALSHYYAGLSHAGLKDYASAIASLRRAAELDPQIRPYARYYMGLAHLGEGDRKEAAVLLHLAGTTPDPALAASAVELSRSASTRAAKDRKTDKGWELRLGIGGEFDSNVVLEPDRASTLPQISDEDDFRFTFSLGGTANLWRNRTVHLTGGYDFSQSLHPELDDFDVQAHNLRVNGRWQPSQPLDLGLEAGVNYYRVGGDSYLLEIHVLPSVGFRIRRWAYTQVSYRWTDQDYRISFFDPTRDGNRHEIALRQYFLLDDFNRYFFLGYIHDMEDPEGRGGSDFQYQGNLAEVGLHTPGPWDTTIDARYLFHNKDYQRPNSRAIPPFSKERNDDTHQISLTLRKNLTPSVEVYAGYRGTINDSNVDVFEYNRHIGSVGFLVVF